MAYRYIKLTLRRRWWATPALYIVTALSCLGWSDWTPAARFIGRHGFKLEAKTYGAKQ
jgi:hypothetical protein